MSDFNNIIDEYAHIRNKALELNQKISLTIMLTAIPKGAIPFVGATTLDISYDDDMCESNEILYMVKALQPLDVEMRKALFSPSGGASHIYHHYDFNYQLFTELVG